MISKNKRQIRVDIWPLCSTNLISNSVSIIRRLRLRDLRWRELAEREAADEEQNSERSKLVTIFNSVHSSQKPSFFPETHKIHFDDELISKHP